MPTAAANKVKMKNKPFIHLYRSARGFYFFDVNKDSIVSINENIYNYLDNKMEYDDLCGDDKDYIAQLEQNGYLSDNHMSEILHPNTDKIEELLETRCQQLILQVTQSCNLVCSYCPYANKTDNSLQRNHSSKHMTWETAKKGIDFFAERVKFKDEIAVSFYGGEPLIAYDLLKKCVTYSKEVFLGKRCRFFMTTNATLLTDEMIDFFAENEFNLCFSIDGPESIHDINRRHPDNTGSFRAAYENLKKTCIRYGSDANNLLSINMVISPKNDLDEVLKFFKDELIKKYQINITSSIADDEYLADKIEIPEEFNEKYSYLYFLSFLKEYQLVEGIELPNFIANRMLLEKRDYISYKRGKPALPKVGAPGGPCTPGENKFFVNYNGDIYPCERVSEISECMHIGTLDTGFDYDKIKKLLNVAQDTAEKCRNCYAQRHCKLCEGHSDDDGVLSGKKRLSSCGMTLRNFDSDIMDCILFKEAKTIYTWRG